MAKGEPHPLTGHLPPDRPHWGGEPLPTGHTPPGATLWPKGEAGLRLLATYGHTLREVASPLTGQRRDGRP